MAQIEDLQAELLAFKQTKQELTLKIGGFASQLQQVTARIEVLESVIDGLKKLGLE